MMTTKGPIERLAWITALVLTLGACPRPRSAEDHSADDSKSAKAEGDAQPPQAAGDEPSATADPSLTVVGVGRLVQGDEPEQAVLDQRRASVEAGLEPLTRCLSQSSVARSEKPAKIEIMFGADAEGRPRVAARVAGIRDDELGFCLREALGDKVTPTPDERWPADVAVLVEITWPG